VTRQPGWQFLQVPGPTNVPDRVRRALSRPVIDHRGPEFSMLALDVLSDLKQLVGTAQPVAVYPSSGTGAWEAALANTLEPGETVLLCRNGHFATLWGALAERYGLRVEPLEGDWRRPPDPDAVEEVLRRDGAGAIKAVLLVHNETSTGVTADVRAVRRAVDAAKHGALLLVDAISSLGSTACPHDGWGADVTIGASQKGLMLPPGLGVNVMGPRALQRSRAVGCRSGYWAWEAYVEANETGFFPYTPATSLLFGLQEALAMLREEGLENVFERHRRHAAATRRAVEAWELEVFCEDEAAFSPSVTAVLVPEGHDADELRRVALEELNMPLGVGFGNAAGRVFRIGHLGDLNDLMLCGVLAGVELSLARTRMPFSPGGVQAALDHLAHRSTVGSVARPSRQSAANSAAPTSPVQSE
jgi:alanine-glyoxylate transaminase/serine-glyoxylate transaminase/serine-pyruvate transaminase